MDTFLAVTKALSDGTRVRILMALDSGELCLCQITDLFGLAPSTLSRHLDVLVRAGLVRARKEGRWRYFRAVGGEAPARVKECLRWVREALREEEAVREDGERLERVRRKDLRELSACYRS